MSALAPVLFLGHGSPMNVVTDNAWRRSWAQLGRTLPRPAAIVCVSAHWVTPAVMLCGAARPPTIHDFYGFPPELYAMRYPAPGAPALAGDIAALLADAGALVVTDYGLDHGSWGVLHAMYPAADVPVLQLGLSQRLDPAGHYRLAQRLAPLRARGVMIVGSGNIVHNLRRYDPADTRPADWAQRFDARVRACLAAREYEPLIDYRSLGAEAALAVPTTEHYLPLLYALAQQRPDEPLQIFNADVTSSMSMTSVLIGADARAIDGG